MKKILILISWALAFNACVSAGAVLEKPTGKSDSVLVSVKSIWKAETYTIDNTRHFPKDTEKDTLLIVDVAYANTGKEPVTLNFYLASLEPMISTYGLVPAEIDFVNPFERFGAAVIGRGAFMRRTLETGEAIQRRLIFVYPKDKQPKSIKFSKEIGEKKVESLVESSLPPIE